MKSAEEWAKKTDSDEMNRLSMDVAVIKQIQLDAMREGMRRAARMCVAERGAKMWFELEKDILSAAEQLKLEDL